MTKPVLDVSYKQHRTALEIVADIAGGWHREAKTYGYTEHTSLDFPGDHTIKIEVSVVPIPRGFQGDARKFPRDQESRAGDEHISYVLRGPLLTVTAQLLDANGKLNPALPWNFTQSSKVALEWAQGPIARHGSASFELRLHLVFNPPLHATVEDLRAWQRQFLPGASAILKEVTTLQRSA